MKMTEAMLTGPGRIELSERDVPDLGRDEVLVEVVSCGVCSTEYPVFRGLALDAPGVSFRYKDYPSSLGHEVSGRVVALGADVADHRVGDRVTGIAYRGSGFATHVIESQSAFVKVPEGSHLECALGEPLAATTNVVRMAGPDFGDAVLIVGDGFMSLLTVAALSRYPLRMLAVSGHHEERLSLARELGASHVVNGAKQDAYWEVRALADGPSHDPDATPWHGGVDIAIDFTGKMASLQLCASLCKPKQRARLMMAGFYDVEPFTLGHYLENRAPMPIPCYPANSQNPMEDLQRAVWAMGDGLFPIERLVTHAFPLDRVADAFRMSAARADGYIKGIVVPDSSKLESSESYKLVGF